MSAKYYYLVTSLPYLRFDRENPITGKIFLAECRKLVSKRDYMAILKVNINKRLPRKSDPLIVKKWKKFDLELRKKLAVVRKDKEHASKKDLPAGLRDALSEEDPLLREKEIDKAKWDFIETEEKKYKFDVTWLMIYFMKLQILGNLSRFDHDRGKQVFEKACEVVI